MPRGNYSYDFNQRGATGVARNRILRHVLPDFWREGPIAIMKISRTRLRVLRNAFPVNWNNANVHYYRELEVFTGSLCEKFFPSTRDIHTQTFKNREGIWLWDAKSSVGIFAKVSQEIPGSSFASPGFRIRGSPPILKAIQSFRPAFAGYVCYEESSVNLGTSVPSRRR